jgi:hypothetical protein
MSARSERRPRVVPGYNHNIQHKGRIYHVQTEDSGPKNPILITHLFVGGTILATQRTSYADLLETEGLERAVRERMKEQHKGMLRALISGSLDALLEAAAHGDHDAIRAIGEAISSQGVMAPPAPPAAAAAPASASPTAPAIPAQASGSIEPLPHVIATAAPPPPRAAPHRPPPRPSSAPAFSSPRPPPVPIPAWVGKQPMAPPPSRIPGPLPQAPARTEAAASWKGAPVGHDTPTRRAMPAVRPGGEATVSPVIVINPTPASAPAASPPPAAARKPAAPVAASPGATPAAAKPPFGAVPAATPAPAASPRATPAAAKPPFGGEVISDKSLDEVILQYLAEEFMAGEKK